MRHISILLLLAVLMMGCDKETKNTLFLRVVTDPGDQAASGAEVFVYSTEADYDARSNPIETKRTPSSGELEFGGLRDNSNYWVFATLGSQSSFGGNPIFMTGAADFQIVRIF